MHLFSFLSLCSFATLACCLVQPDRKPFRLDGPVPFEEEIEPDPGPIPDRPPIFPIRPIKTCSRACCDNRKTRVYLGSLSPGLNNGMTDIVTVVSTPTTSGNVGSYNCNKRALLKVKFDRIKGCRYCGHYMLKIDLELSREARGPGTRRILNIGDSVSNDGWKGDYNHQKYDAEADGSGNDIRIYGNDHCTDSAFNPLIFSNVLASAATHVTIYVANQYIRVTNDMGFDKQSRSNCLYALNGQADTTVNEDIYVALNRVVTGRSDRNGYGVCAATLSWVCGG